MSAADKGRRLRPVHRAGHVNEVGGVSARCFKRPKTIDLRRATWTNRPEAVTCPKCLALAKLGGAS